MGRIFELLEGSSCSFGGSGVEFANGSTSQALRDSVLTQAHSERVLARAAETLRVAQVLDKPRYVYHHDPTVAL